MNEPPPAERDDYGPLRRMLYGFLWLVTNALFRLWFGVRVRGRPTPFPRGPLVIAANHCSYLDPVLLGLCLPRRIVYLVTSDVYDRPAFRPWMWIFGCIRIGEEAVNFEAMRQAVAALRRGLIVGIFPEGGISSDGRLQPGEIGVATLLQRGGAPVLAAGLVGTFEALPRGGGFPRRHPLEVVFGGVIEPAAVAPDATPREARRLLRDRVMAALAQALPPGQQPAAPPPAP